MKTHETKSASAHPAKYGPRSEIEYRAEGRTLRESILNGVAYLRKYRDKKFSASSEILRYFERARKAVAHAFSARRKPGTKDARIQVLGDLMWIRDGWGEFLDPALLGRLSESDLVFGNLETVISRNYPVKSFFPDYLGYNSPPEFLRGFRRPAGRPLFSALSLANNHVLDHGARGARDTVDFLRHEGIPSSGVRLKESDPAWTEHEAKGIRVGFIAYGWGVNGFDSGGPETEKVTLQSVPGLVPEVDFARLDLSELEANVRRMRASGIEFVVLSFHWGYEYEYYPDPAILKVGHRLIEAGVDCLVGHHPHVQQPPEILHASDGRRGLILYSVGNFATTMYTEACRLGLAQELVLARESVSGKIEWSFGRTTWVYNFERDPRTGKRSLVWLRDGVPLTPRIREVWEWTRSHAGLPAE